MPEPSSKSRAGWGWLVLIALPPVIIATGVVTLFVWQGSKGGVTPKWKKPLVPVATNALPAPLSNAPAATAPLR